MSFPVARPLRLVPSLRGPDRRIDALRRIELDVDAGERVALFGENGAGKSTLLRLIAGLLLPSAGRVSIGGRAPTARDGAPKVGLVIGDERSFYWRLSGLENLRFFAALEELFGAAAQARIGHLLDAVGLARDAHRRVAEYSAGMRQRLAIARGLLIEPDVLLLDEPTRSLDPPGTDAVHALLGGALTRGCTLLVATNRYEDAAALCTRVAVLRDGSIAGSQSLAPPASVEQLAEFVRAHLRPATVGA